MTAPHSSSPSVRPKLRFGFAVVERELGGGDPSPRARSRDEAALGIVDAAEAAEVFRTTTRDAVVPGLARFGIDAEEAWRRRALA